MLRLKKLWQKQKLRLMTKPDFRMKQKRRSVLESQQKLSQRRSVLKLRRPRGWPKKLLKRQRRSD